MRTESRELLAVGIFGRGSQLGDRIEMLVRRGRSFSPRTSAGGVAASALVLSGLMLGGALAPRWIAFAQQSPRQFEAASVKPNNSGSNNGYIRIAPGGKLLAANATLRSLILQAYEVQDFQLSGGPAWLNSGRFDIEGRGQGSPAPSQILQMLQALLADRFQLKIHREKRELPVYALLIGKNGPKLEPSRGNGCFDPIADPTAFVAPTTLPCGGFRNFSNQMAGAKITMSRFTANLSKYMGRAVVDKTGLGGAYDIILQWTPDETQAFLATGPAAADASGPSIFSAVQEQLGLRLDSQKGAVEVFVIDHLEKPDAN